MQVAALAERNKQIKVQVLPEMHREVRIRAAEVGVSITAYVIEVLERELEREPQEAEELEG